MEPSIRLSAFRWVPSFAQGLARDFRVRWALEEAGFPYEEQLLGRDDLATERCNRSDRCRRSRTTDSLCSNRALLSSTSRSNRTY